MSDEYKSFIELCLAGEVLADEIDDYVDKWHEGGSDQTLAQFLGMKVSEYKRWAIDPSILPYILSARRKGETLKFVLEAQPELKMAARSGSTSDADRIREWLANNWEDSWGPQPE